MTNELAAQIIDLQNISALWGIGASIASIILAVVAVILSVYFYTQAKNSEKEVTKSLSKIEAQADTLSKITGKQLDRLTKHATERRTSENDPDIRAFIDLATSMTQGLTQTSQEQVSQPQHNRNETLKYTIGSLYYCSTTNYYALMSLPEAALYDENNDFHATTKRLLDLTKSDVIFLTNHLKDVTQEEIEQSGMKALYDEAISIWVPRTKDSASSFSYIEQIKEKT